MVFGKTKKNLRKHIRVDLVAATQKDRLHRLIADPTYRIKPHLREHHVAVHDTKIKSMNGQARPDLSKHLMYDFWYNDIKIQHGKFWGQNQTAVNQYRQPAFPGGDAGHIRTCGPTSICMTSVNTTGILDSPHHSGENKKVVSKFKEECNDVPIAKFMGWCPKLYSILKADDAEIRKAKGIQRAVVKDRHHEHTSNVCMTGRRCGTQRLCFEAVGTRWVCTSSTRSHWTQKVDND